MYIGKVNQRVKVVSSTNIFKNGQDATVQPFPNRGLEVNFNPSLMS
jgi:hypothetical protein